MEIPTISINIRAENAEHKVKITSSYEYDKSQRNLQKKREDKALEERRKQKVFVDVKKPPIVSGLYELILMMGI